MNRVAGVRRRAENEGDAVPTDAEMRVELLRGRPLFYFQEWLNQRNITLTVSECGERRHL